MTMPELDPLEAELLAGAAAALRKRAERQAKIAAEGTTFGDRGAVIKRGEAAIAERLSATLAALAAEFEREMRGCVANPLNCLSTSKWRCP